MEDLEQSSLEEKVDLGNLSTARQECFELLIVLYEHIFEKYLIKKFSFLILSDGRKNNC